ncbi:MAG: PliI family lysozyme inhibitor of I-type lysozyme [Alphaproteobacteria bacterium]
MKTTMTGAVLAAAMIAGCGAAGQAGRAVTGTVSGVGQAATGTVGAVAGATTGVVGAAAGATTGAVGAVAGATTGTVGAATGAVTGGAAAAAGAIPTGPLDRTLERDGIRFRVTSANSGSINQVTIAPSGLEKENSPVTVEVDGTVTGVETADLDGDGSPEILVFANSAGSGSYGSLVGYAANRRKSMTQIYLPPILGNSPEGKGYMGHDTFRVDGRRLLRSFPVFRKGDPNCCPSGGTRTIEYALVRGEAGWILKSRGFKDA